MILDSLHHAILLELSANARQSYAEIGRKVGLSPSAAAERVQKMEDYGIVTGYGVKLNQHKVGLELSALIALKLSQTRMRLFKKEVRKIEEVERCLQVTGDDCVVLIVHVRNSAHPRQTVGSVD